MRQPLLDHPTLWKRLLSCGGRWSVVVILPIATVLTPGLLTHPTNPEKTARPAGTNDDGASTDPLRAVEVTLRRGDTLLSVLTHFGLARASAHAVSEAVRPFFSPRDLRAGQNLRLLLDPHEQTVQGLEYILNNALLRVISTTEGWSAELKETPFVRKARAVHGSVNESLYETGIEAGLTPLQILNLAAIFEYDIDFFSDFQKGDTFSVAFEEIGYADGRRTPGRVLAAEISAGGNPFHAIYYPGKEGEGSYYDLDGLAIKRAFLRAPLSYRRISSRYSLNRRHPIFRMLRPHLAIDYAAPAGTPVVAIGQGRISYAGWRSGYGKLVEIRHPNGYVTRSAHFAHIASGIRAGKHVGQGDVIGYVGQTGHATGPHLHFEVLRGGKKINFLGLNIPRGERLRGRELVGFVDLRDRRLALLQEKPLKLVESSS